MRNALILTEAGGSKGYGHLVRCTALYQALAEAGVNAELLVDMAGQASELLLPGFKQARWKQRGFGLPALLKDKDICIIDSYTVDEETCCLAASLVPVTAFFDDTHRISYPRGIIINAACSNPASYGRGVTVICGSRFASLRRDFWKLPERVTRRCLSRVLVSLGGGARARRDAMHLAANLAALCGQCSFIVMGTDGKRLPARCVTAEAATASQVKRLMASVDAAVIAGGQTSLEAAACGVPVICVSYADNQAGNIGMLTGNGCAEFAGKIGSPDLAATIGSRIKAMSYLKRLRMAQKAQRFIDGRGSMRIARLLVSRAGKL